MLKQRCDCFSSRNDRAHDRAHDQAHDQAHDRARDWAHDRAPEACARSWAQLGPPKVDPTKGPRRAAQARA